MIKNYYVFAESKDNKKLLSVFDNKIMAQKLVIIMINNDMGVPQTNYYYERRVVDN